MYTPDLGLKFPYCVAVSCCHGVHSPYSVYEIAHNTLKTFYRSYQSSGDLLNLLFGCRHSVLKNLNP